MRPIRSIQQKSNRMISVAPMLGVTDHYMRYFLRLIAQNIFLYTEMIPILALLQGQRSKQILSFHPHEHPISLQLSGSHPKDLALGARMGEEAGYDEINFNVGCPSPRAHAGNFGACLMLEPKRVANCIAAMAHATSIPVTLKCRIGVNEQDSLETLHYFIALCIKAGCKHFIVHARKAWLSGINPKKNRLLPPLEYEYVYQIKKLFPTVTIVINGGINQLSQIHSHLIHVDGVMLGRKIRTDPYFLSTVQAHYDQSKAPLSREHVLYTFLNYILTEKNPECPIAIQLRPLLNLFHGQAGGAIWRRTLQQAMHTTTQLCSIEPILHSALMHMQHIHDSRLFDNVPTLKES